MKEMKDSHNGETLTFCTDFNKYLPRRLELSDDKPFCTNIDGQKVQKKPDVLIIEVGGTVVDDEAFFLMRGFSRMFEYIIKSDKSFTAVEHMTQMGCTLKTKLLQNSLNDLKSFGITNDILFYRGTIEMESSNLEIVSENCGLKKIIFCYRMTATTSIVSH